MSALGTSLLPDFPSQGKLAVGSLGKSVPHGILEPGAPGGHLPQPVACTPPPVVSSLLERRGTGRILPWGAQCAGNKEPLHMRSRERAIVDLASVPRARS